MIYKTNRIIRLIVLAVLAVAIPYFTAVISIALSGDRYFGMTVSVFLGLFLVHLIYGLVFLKIEKTFQKIGIAVLVSILIYGVFFLLMSSGLYIKTNWDIYGFWDRNVLNFLVGFLFWEIVSLIYGVIKK